MQIEVKDIRKYFGPVKANDQISFKLNAGKIYGILGENGAGKSTLMKILSGYQSADSGEIILGGKNVYFTSPTQALKAGVGMLYQDPLDIPPFNVVENFLLGVDKGFGLGLKTARKEIKKLVEQYGFEVDISSEIDNLSLGERQQLELVRLLVGGANVLILDEPTTGISGDQKDTLFNSIRQLAHQDGKTLILVSHKLEEVQELCDHAMVLRHGKLVGGLDIPCDNDELVSMMFGQVPAKSKRPEIELGEPMLKAENLSVHTYRLNIDEISFEVKSGEVFGLAGLEGSGQSLLIKACSGLIQPNKGALTVNGEDFTHRSYHKTVSSGVAFVGAGRLEEGLVTGLSLTEHMVLSRSKHEFWIDWETNNKLTEERIQQYKVVGKPDSNADQLSGGNQQRFMFSMLNSTLKLILMENPTRGLDVRSINYIWEKLFERREDGTAILFLSADLDEVIERSDRIAVFSGGKMSRIVNARETNVEELGHMIGGQI